MGKKTTRIRLLLGLLVLIILGAALWGCAAASSSVADVNDTPTEQPNDDPNDDTSNSPLSASFSPKQFGTSAIDIGYSVAVDSAGKIYVTGFT